MLWTDERIAKSVDVILARASRMYAAKAMQEMRDDYERTIAEITDYWSVMDRKHRDRIAELKVGLAHGDEMESMWARHAHNLESSVLPTMRKDYEARIAELEAQS